MGRRSGLPGLRHTRGEVAASATNTCCCDSTTLPNLGTEVLGPERSAESRRDVRELLSALRLDEGVVT